MHRVHLTPLSPRLAGIFFLFCLLGLAGQSLAADNAIYQSGSVCELENTSYFFTHSPWQVCAYPNGGKLPYTRPMTGSVPLNIGDYKDVDDNVQISLPFLFTYEATTQNLIYLFPNCSCLSFSDSGGEYNVANFNSNQQRICPLMQSYSSSGNIYYWTESSFTGGSGKALIIEYEDASFHCSPSGGSINFQIELRSTNDIAFHYGSLTRGSGCNAADEAMGLGTKSGSASSLSVSSRVVPSVIQIFSLSTLVGLSWNALAFNYGYELVETNSGGSSNVTSAYSSSAPLCGTGIPEDSTLDIVVHSTCLKADGTYYVNPNDASFPEIETTAKYVSGYSLQSSTLTSLVFQFTALTNPYTIESYVTPGSSYDPGNRIAQSSSTSTTATFNNLNSGTYTWAAYIHTYCGTETYYKTLTACTVLPTPPTTATWANTYATSLFFTSVTQGNTNTVSVELLVDGKNVGYVSTTISGGSLTVNGLTAGTNYTMRIYGTGGTTRSSTYLERQVGTLPNPVTNLQVTDQSSTSLTVDFTPSTGAACYKIVAYWIAQLTSSYDIFYGQPPFVFGKGLQSEEAYKVCVFAGNHNAAGGNQGFESTGLSITNVYTMAYPIADLHTTSVTSTSIDVAWTVSSNGNQYKVEITPDDQTYYLASSVASYQFTSGLSGGVTYTITVHTGWNNGGDCLYDDGVVLQVTTFPAVVTDVQAVYRTNHLLEFTWDPSTGATAYKLELYSGTSLAQSVPSTTSCSHEFTSLSASTSYTVKIYCGTPDGFDTNYASLTTSTQGLSSCTADHYGNNSMCVPCPDHSTSPAGAWVVSECVCDSTYTRVNNKCICDANYYDGGESCEECPANSASPQGSDSITDCTCVSPFGGDAGGPCGCPADQYQSGDECDDCPQYSTSPEFSDSINDCTCLGHFILSGACCVCRADYYLDGSSCDACPLYSSSPQGSTDISQCVCNMPFQRVSNQCVCPPNTYLDSSSCADCPDYSASPQGSDSVDDCVCLSNFTGPAGGPCVCPPHSHPQNDAYCACDSVYMTSDCTACLTGYTNVTSNCEQCATGYHKVNADQPVPCAEDIQCDPPNCSGRGSCNVFSGQCLCTGKNFDWTTGCATCLSGYYLAGGNCNQNKDCQCGAYGTCDVVTGKCNCSSTNMDAKCTGCNGTEYGPAPNCTQCNVGYHDYPFCRVDKECPSPDCSGWGTCNLDHGKCQCENIHMNSNCSACVANYDGYPNCTVIIPCDFDCYDHGNCNNGTCECFDCFDGDVCDSCATGYYDYPTCYQLLTCTPPDCSGHGTCDNQTSFCGCDTNWGGSRCDVCASGYQNETAGCWKTITCNDTCVHGACNEQVGKCVCDALWSGDDCNDYDSCSSSPCENGATCQNGDEMDYTCSCTNDYWGQNCANENLTPCVVSVTPTVLPLNGGNLNVTGDNFQEPGLTVYLSIGGQDVGSASIASGAIHDISGSRRQTLQTFTVTVPSVTTEGCLSLRFINPGGAEYTYSGSIFITNDCPAVGKYGVGSACHSCPSSCAICPGGNRIFPEDGCWSPDNTTVPTACDGPLTSARCIGGEEHHCAAGYEGDSCGTCSDGYQLSEDGTSCDACPSNDCSAAAAKKKSGMSPGAIAAIVIILILAFVIAVVAGLYYYRFRYHNRKNVENELADMDTEFMGIVRHSDMEHNSSRQKLTAPSQTALRTSGDHLPLYEEEDVKQHHQNGGPPAYVPAAAAAAAAAVTAAGGGGGGVEEFRRREVLAPYEVEGFCVSRITQFLRSNAALAQRLESNPKKYLIMARVAHLLTTKVLKTHEQDIAIRDGAGNATKFCDGMEIAKHMDTHFQEVFDAVLAEVTKSDAKSDNLELEVYMGEDQGPRPRMEDMFIVHMFANELVGNRGTRYSMVGVYDGHGGVECSAYVEQHLHMALLRDEDFPDSIEDALRESFLSTNERFFVYQERESCNPSVGATGVLAVFTQNKLWVAWAGDSEVAFIRKDVPPERVCEVHKASLPSEQERIQQKGGFVSAVNGVTRVCGALAVSRAFGDLKYRQYITSEPDVKSYDLDGTEEYLVVTCDGVWDVMNEVDIAEFVRNNRESAGDQIAQQLTMHARALGSTDNITAIVICFGQGK